MKKIYKSPVAFRGFLFFLVTIGVIFTIVGVNQMREQATVQPYKYVYDIVIKEKYIVHDGHDGRYLLRYYNKTMGKHYMMENHDAFIEFDIGEPLVFWEKNDGISYTFDIQRHDLKTKAEVEL